MSVLEELVEDVPVDTQYDVNQMEYIGAATGIESVAEECDDGYGEYAPGTEEYGDDYS